MRVMAISFIRPFTKDTKDFFSSLWLSWEIVETLRGGAQWKEVRSPRGVPLRGILELKPLLPLSLLKKYFILLCVCVRE